jgi:methylglyoxal synthase
MPVTMNIVTSPHGPAAPRVALIAHDTCKDDLTAWATFNRGTLSCCRLFATGTTGQRVFEATDLPIERLLSGPAGGDAQVGAMLAEGRLDYVIFFWDPLTTQPHDVDVKALLRLAVLYNVPTACNRATADCLISSPLFFDAEMLREDLGYPELASASA